MLTVRMNTMRKIETITNDLAILCGIIFFDGCLTTPCPYN